MSTDTKTRYTEGIGRRKEAVARVRLTPAAKSSFTVNEKSLEDYFSVADYRSDALKALHGSGVDETYSVSVVVKGGGIAAQADAIRHGVARALVSINGELRKILKPLGLLTRDPRSKERKKFGLRKARRAPQWSKR